MSNLMNAMFWGGLVMAAPAVIIGVGAIVFIYRQDRAAAKGTGDRRAE